MGRVGGLLALLEAILARLGALAGCLGRCGARPCGLLDPSWEYLGASWEPLGPSPGLLGPSWGLLGGLLGRLGAISAAS